MSTPQSNQQLTREQVLNVEFKNFELKLQQLSIVIANSIGLQVQEFEKIGVEVLIQAYNCAARQIDSEKDINLQLIRTQACKKAFEILVSKISSKRNAAQSYVVSRDNLDNTFKRPNITYTEVVRGEPISLESVTREKVEEKVQQLQQMIEDDGIIQGKLTDFIGESKTSSLDETVTCLISQIFESQDNFYKLIIILLNTNLDTMRFYNMILAQTLSHLQKGYHYHLGLVIFTILNKSTVVEATNILQYVLSFLLSDKEETRRSFSKLFTISLSQKQQLFVFKQLVEFLITNQSQIQWDVYQEFDMLNKKAVMNLLAPEVERQTVLSAFQW